LGYANVRVADVVNRARVSRQSFYALFADKEECFLEAHAAGLELIVERLAHWTAAGAAADDEDPTAPVRGAVAAYLVLAADEPEFARCMLIELPAIGPAGLEARLTAHRQIAALLRTWHHSARQDHPDWPAVPDGRYPAAIGAVHDLLFDTVASGHADRAPNLREEGVSAVLALLQIPAG
jgi:AcrR family transcriptional regulator